MGRTRNRLTAMQVKSAPDGSHNDGDNLHLRVNGDNKKWVFRYVRAGRATEIGLGSAADVPLKQARDCATGTWRASLMASTRERRSASWRRRGRTARPSRKRPRN
jgi:hypothetical protein